MSELQNIIKSKYDNDWIALSNSDKIFQLTNLVSSQKNHYGFKPQGLWLGLGDNWLQYIKDNDMTDWITEYCSAFSIELGSNILILKDKEDYVNFTKRYSKNSSNIKWEVVARKYDGIVAYQPRRFALDRSLSWTYGWDITSACIWNSEGIKDIDEILNGCNDESFESFKRGGKIHFSCVLINQDELLNKYNQVHENLFSHHSTIEYKPKKIKGLEVGKQIDLKITGRLTNDKLDVLLVDNPYSKNKYPHITLSTAKGVKPVASNFEIENNLDKIVPLNDSIDGEITVCMFEQGGEIEDFKKGGKASKVDSKELKMEKGGIINNPYAYIKGRFLELEPLIKKNPTPSQYIYVAKKSGLTFGLIRTYKSELSREQRLELEKQYRDLAELLENSLSKKEINRSYKGDLTEKYAYHFTDIYGFSQFCESTNIQKLSLTTNPYFGEEEMGQVKDFRGMGVNKKTLYFSDLPIKIVFDLQKLKATQELIKGSSDEGTYLGEYEVIWRNKKPYFDFFNFISWVEVKKEFKQEFLKFDFDVFINDKEREFTIKEFLKLKNISLKDWENKDVKEYLFGGSKPKYEKGGILNNPNFKSWFGDSKVVDENGNPLVVYHGTQLGTKDEMPFSSFKTFANPDFVKFDDIGIWFTESKQTANKYSQRIGSNGVYENGHTYSCYLKIDNPWILEGSSGWDEMVRIFNHKVGTEHLAESVNKPDNIKLFVDYLKDRGKDGIIIKNVDFDSGYSDNEIVDYYIALDPTQIKSAIGNSGEYDPNNPSIIMEKGGKLFDKRKGEFQEIAEGEKTIKNSKQGYNKYLTILKDLKNGLKKDKEIDLMGVFLNIQADIREYDYLLETLTPIIEKNNYTTTDIDNLIPKVEPNLKIYPYTIDELNDVYYKVGRKGLKNSFKQGGILNNSNFMAEGGQVCTYDFDGYDLAKKKCGNEVDVYLIPAEYKLVSIHLFDNHLPLWLYYNYLARIVISKEDVFTFKKQCLEKFEITNPVRVLVKPYNDKFWKKSYFDEPRSYMSHTAIKGIIQKLEIVLVQDGSWANKFKERTSGLTIPNPKGVHLNTVIHEFAHLIDVLRYNKKNPNEDVIVTHERGFLVALVDVLIACKRNEIPIVSMIDSKALIIQKALQKPSFVERYKDTYGLNVFDGSVPKDLKEYDERFASLKGSKLNKEQAKEMFNLIKKYQDEVLMGMAMINPNKANRLFKSTNDLLTQLKKYS